MSENTLNTVTKEHGQINNALEILKQIGLPSLQLNRRSALTLLALINLKPNEDWNMASNPLVGITPIIEFIKEYYEIIYAPNSRESIRRQTIYQFLAAGIITLNPDNPNRATNSGKTVYQIDTSTLGLLQTFKTENWEQNLYTYLDSVQTLKERYSQNRKMNQMPIKIDENRSVYLSPGGQNILVKEIIEEFATRFVPGGFPVYIGDTGNKFLFLNAEFLSMLGVNIDNHGKMPDILIYYPAKKWLLIIEAVTSHGPIDPKRLEELKQLFQNTATGLVFVTAFLTRKAMTRYLPTISWETEVWVAEDPSHMIHFNGERFLGAYDY